MHELQSNTERALISCSLWLHIGFIGACTLAGGLLLLFGGGANWLWALGLVLIGGALAAAGWRRGFIVLEHAEGASTVAANAPSKTTARASSRQTRRGAIAMLSPMPAQSNRRQDHDLRRPAPE